MMGEKDPLYGLGDPLPPLMSDIFLDNGKKKNKNKDPLDSLLFSDPMTMALRKENRTDSDELDKTGTEEEGTEDDEDWTSSAPPLDYLERVKVRKDTSSRQLKIWFTHLVISLAKTNLSRLLYLFL